MMRPPLIMFQRNNKRNNYTYKLDDDCCDFQKKTKAKEQEKIVALTRDKTPLVLTKYLDPINHHIVPGNFGLEDSFVGEGKINTVRALNYYKKIADTTFYSELGIVGVSLEDVDFQKTPWQLLVDRLQSLNYKEAKDFSMLLENYCTAYEARYSLANIETNDKKMPERLEVEKRRMTAIERERFDYQVKEGIKDMADSNNYKHYFVLEYRTDPNVDKKEIKMTSINFSKALLDLLGYSVKKFQSILMRRKGIPEFIFTSEYYKYWSQALNDFLGFKEEKALKIELLDAEENLLKGELTNTTKFFISANDIDVMCLIVNINIFKESYSKRKLKQPNEYDNTDELTKYAKIGEEFCDKYHPGELLEEYRPKNKKKVCSYRMKQTPN